MIGGLLYRKPQDFVNRWSPMLLVLSERSELSSAVLDIMVTEPEDI